jgi:hypothetical protein
MVLLLDEEVDRTRDRVRAEFDRAIEAVRAGTVFAHNIAEARKWRRKRDRKIKPLSEVALLGAIMNIARIFPDNVEIRTA